MKKTFFFPKLHLTLLRGDVIILGGKIVDQLLLICHNRKRRKNDTLKNLRERNFNIAKKRAKQLPNTHSSVSGATDKSATLARKSAGRTSEYTRQPSSYTSNRTNA